jgi:hypothetical protein
MEQMPESKTTSEPASGRRIIKIVLLVVGVAVVSSLATVWVTTRYLFPKEFVPVTLDAGERKTLETKIERLAKSHPSSSRDTAADPSKGVQQPSKPLEPERYSEEGARREVTFTERELNALLATHTDLAQRLTVDLSQNLVSAKLLVPVDPEVPLVGGKTVKVTAGLEVRFAEGRPVVAIKGVSLYGVPVPNAWMGGIKNLDLVKEFVGQGGFWQAFAAGVEDLRIEEGRLTVRLKE